MSKLSVKISPPPAMKFAQGTRNPSVGISGSGMAPKPTGGAPILGNDRPSMPSQGHARVKGVGTGPSLRRLPLQSPTANVVGQTIGQPNPETGAAATAKPNRKGKGAAFFGEY